MEFIQSIRPVIDLLTALLSPILAITVAYIAYQQWKINDRKAAKELQQEKLEIYMAVKRFLNYFDSYIKIDQKLYTEFEEAVALADFVFDSEVIEWLFEVQINASCWLDLEIMLETNQNIELKERRKEEAYKEQCRDHLQNAHCEVLDVFKDKVIVKKS